MMLKNHISENLTPHFIRQESSSETKLETIKHHLTCAAKISEEVGLFVKTAEIKQVNADICRMQGKDDDAGKLDYSVSELKSRAKAKRVS